MTRPYPNALALSHTLLRVLIIVNLIVGGLIANLLIASLIAEGWVMQALGVPKSLSSPELFIRMRLIMFVGICSVPIVHFILTRLWRIVKTVSTGNPFVADNAGRLQ